MSKSKLAYMLGNKDIEKLIPYEVPIHHYKNLSSFKTIDDLLYPNDACIIFFQNGEDKKSILGHWTCLVRSPKSSNVRNTKNKEDNQNSIVFFDSYGTIPDDQKEFIDPKYSEMVGQLENTLTRLLYLSNKNLEYNEVPFQKMKDGINTCGRYCALKILSKQLPLEMFQEFMLRPTIKPDDKAVLLTQPVLDGKISGEELEQKLYELMLN